MKKIFNFASVAAVIAATILSCQTVEEEALINDELNKNEQATDVPTISSLTFSISDNEKTKTVIAETGGKKYSNWESGDKIGYVTSNSDKGSTAVTLGSPATFTIDTSSGLAVDDEVEVWYPYLKDETDKSSVQMIIPVSQIQDGDSFDFDAMPMVAEPITITSEMLDGDDYAGSINFVNLASLIEFKVFSTEVTYASEKVAAITFNAGSSNIAGHFNMNVGAVDFDTPASLAISGYTGKTVTTSLTSPVSIGTDKESARNVYMVVAPGTYSGNIVVATDAAFYTIPISGKEFERSGFKSFGIDLATSVATRRSLKGNFTWSLAQASYSSASDKSVVWKYGLLSMEHSQNSGRTEANNYIPPTYAHSRFYTGNNLIFTPITSTWTIDRVDVTATSDDYAAKIPASSWTNASASSSSVVASIRPNNSSLEFKTTSLNNQVRATEVKIYFDNTNYSISDGTITGDGSLSYSAASAKVNTTITITATPGIGQILSSLSVKDSGNNDITVTSNQFRMPASNVTVSATFVDGSSPSISMATNAAEDTNTAAGTTATLSGTITLEGGAVIGSVTEAGFYYKAVGAVSYSKVTLGSAPSTTTYTYALTSLTPGQEYTYYSYAVYDSGSEVFGDATEKTFTPLKLWSMTLDSNASGNNQVHWTSQDATSLTLSTVTWTPAMTWKESSYTYWGNYKDYCQIGAGKSSGHDRYVTSLTLSTSDISGTIKGVLVDCASYNGLHTLSVSVNDTAYRDTSDETTQNTPSGSAANIDTLAFYGSSSGTIVLSFSGPANSRALYIKKVAILYY